MNLDISALTSLAMAELSKQAAGNGAVSTSALQKQLDILQQQQRQQQQQLRGVPAASVAPNAIATALPTASAISKTIESDQQPPLAMPTRHSWELDWLSCELVKAREEIQKLREENAQLRGLAGAAATATATVPASVPTTAAAAVATPVVTSSSATGAVGGGAPMRPAFMVHSSRPISQTALEVTKQEAIEAILKSNHSQTALEATKQQALDAIAKSTQQQQQAAVIQQALGSIQQAIPAQPGATSQKVNQSGAASGGGASAGLSVVKPVQGPAGDGGGRPPTQDLHELQKQMLGTANFKELQALCNQASTTSGPMDMSKVENLLMAVQAENAKQQQQQQQPK